MHTVNSYMHTVNHACRTQAILLLWLHINFFWSCECGFDLRAELETAELPVSGVHILH